MSTLTQKLTALLWDELEPIIENFESPSLWEAQVMAYFPHLRLTSLLGSTFVQDGVPKNMVAYGPSFLLLEDEIPEEKEFYVFVIVRRPISSGLGLVYLLPYVEWDDTIRVEQLEALLDGERGREMVLEIERKLPTLSREWLEDME